MGIGEILSNSFKYPLGDKENFKYVAALFLLIGLATAGIISSVEFAFWMNNRGLMNMVPILALIGGFLVFIVGLIAPGYMVSVVKEGIDQSGLIPSLDIVKNIIDTIKLAILGFIYFIIPGIIAGILFAIIAAMASGMSSRSSGIILILFLIVSLIVLIVYVAFELLYIVGVMRFAHYDSLSAAISVSEVWEDLKAIGILKLLIAIIIFGIVESIIISIGLLVAAIPIIGGLIFGALILPFALLVFYYALGSIYAEIA